MVNDHVLKPAFHDLWTGKLSDVAGLILLPLLMLAVAEGAAAVLRRRIPWWTGAACAGAVGLVFLLCKSWSVATIAYCRATSLIEWPFLSVRTLVVRQSWAPMPQAHMVRDPTDLLVLPILVIPLVVSRRRATQQTRAQASRAG